MPEEKMPEDTLRWIVTGRVQGVSYRFFTRRAAQDMGISGWVRNLPDGTVEAQLRGDAEQVETLRKQLNKGPSMGRVDAIFEEKLAPDTDLPKPFEIHFD